MKIITREYKVYKYNELSKEAQERALSDYMLFITHTTPYVLEYSKDEILSKIKKYNYLKTGELFNS